jgi:hypothetical protein
MKKRRRRAEPIELTKLITTTSSFRLPLRPWRDIGTVVTTERSHARRTEPRGVPNVFFKIGVCRKASVASGHPTPGTDNSFDDLAPKVEAPAIKTAEASLTPALAGKVPAKLKLGRPPAIVLAPSPRVATSATSRSGSACP